MKTVNNRPSNTEQTRKLQAVLITISALLLILGSFAVSLSMSVTYNAFLIILISMVSLFIALIISDN